MKKILITLCIVFAFGLKLNAQPHEKVETLKVGFITQKLNLTTEEAKVFWPVYNKYSDELKKLRQVTKEKLNDEFDELSKMSDADADKMLNEMTNFRMSEAELIKKYAAEFKKVLPVKKVVLLFKAENDFKRELLDKLMQRKGRKLD